MSAHLMDESLVDRIAQVEGPEWKELQDRCFRENRTGDQSVCAARAAAALYLEFGEELDPFTIYGYGGYHRYHVRPDGRVVFSAHHCALPGKEALAREAGFDIE